MNDSALGVLDLLVVGAGPTGIALGAEARAAGPDVLRVGLPGARPECSAEAPAVGV